MARALIAFLACWSAPALAQAIADPTRPPSFAEAAAGVARLPASPLQSVILRAGEKPRALLGGEWIELGGTYNGARLVGVTETSVVLQGSTGRETLYLTPDAEKKPARATPARQRAGETREQK